YPLPSLPPYTLFFFCCHAAHRSLHSFPTRRSSDLAGAPSRRRSRGSPPAARPRHQHVSERAAYGLRPAESRDPDAENGRRGRAKDRKSTRLNSSHVAISYAVFCLKKKNKTRSRTRL